jgi:prepilin-type N-terminal cleavage/methylation domain-containing protein
MKENQKTKGFTLIETLVSLFIFGMMSVALVNIFVSTLNTQTRILQNQDLMSQSSYLLEHMGKIIRMAQRDDTGSCAPTGESYKVENGIKSITFLAYDSQSSSYKCVQFLLESNAIKEKRSTDETAANFGTAQAVTSSSVYVSDLAFNVTGDSLGDTLQPKVTIMINMRYNNASNPPRLIMQTSVSQRKLDVL